MIDGAEAPPAQAPFGQLRKIAPRQRAANRPMPGHAREQQQEYRHGDGIGVKSVRMSPGIPLAYFLASAGVVVTGPMPTSSNTASPSLAPSKCTVLARSVTTLPAGMG